MLKSAMKWAIVALVCVTAALALPRSTAGSDLLVLFCKVDGTYVCGGNCWDVEELPGAFCCLYP